MEHCFIHREVAFQVILWLMFLAFNLFWCFLSRNRRSFEDCGFSVRETAEKMRNALEYIKDRELGPLPLRLKLGWGRPSGDVAGVAAHTPLPHSDHNLLPTI